MLKKIAPENKIKKLVSSKASLNKTALSFVDAIDFINKKDVVTTALKVIKSYKGRIKDETLSKTDMKKDPALLINRVQNEINFQITREIQDKYKGERARWLPSSAGEPDPEHALNYGKEYIIGEGINGEEPGDRYGCQCGQEILVNETQLEL